jgi:hypothetical protein
VLPKSVTTAQKHSRTQANFYSENKSAGAGFDHKSENGGWGTNHHTRDENDPKANSPMITSPNLEIPHLNNY